MLVDHNDSTDGPSVMSPSIEKCSEGVFSDWTSAWGGPPGLDPYPDGALLHAGRNINNVISKQIFANTCKILLQMHIHSHNVLSQLESPKFPWFIGSTHTSISIPC